MCLLCFYCCAQERPRIGLVLSGGGAKGFAHVGAIQVLEEAGIKIDYIGGTSMGAIIGGLYAAGYSGHQIDSLLDLVDVQEAIFGKQIRANHSIFDKTYGERYFLTLSITDFKLQFPSALSDGTGIQELLSELLGHCDNQPDFRKLPTPFLCIGTKMVDGTEVVFEQGKLSQAIMASSAFPGLLPPVEIDGALITDGGILNNFPGKEIRDKGMDLVIGVSVDKGLKEADQLDNIYSIVSQISFYESARRTREQEKFCDLIIHPDTEGYEVTSFSAKDILIENGRQAALKFIKTLKDIGAYQRGEMAKQEIDSATEEDEAEIHPKISKLDGPMEQIEHLTGMVRLGVHYDQIYHSSLLLNLTLQDFLIKNSTLSSNLVLGDNVRYGIHYLKRNTNLPDFGFNASLNYSDINIPLSEPIPLPNELFLKDFTFRFRDQTTEFYTNLLSNRKFNFGASAGIKYFKLSNDDITADANLSPFSQEKNWYFTLSNFFYFDTKEQRYFTSRGALINASFDWIYPLTRENGIQDKFSYNFDLTAEYYFPLSGVMTLGSRTDGGVLLGQRLSAYNYLLGSVNQNLINNWRPFIGLELGDLIGTKLLRQTLFLQYKLRKNLFFSVSGNIAYMSELINHDRSSFVAKSLGLRLGLDTAIGPIELSYGFSNVSDGFNLTLGHWF